MMSSISHRPGRTTPSHCAESCGVPVDVLGECKVTSPPGVILIVEDDLTAAQILRDILEEAGHAIVHAARGEAALAILASPACRVELVLLDLGLPDIDGLQLLRTIRERAGDPRLPVIIVTGRGAPADRTLAVQSQADDFLVKPVLPEELRLKVRTALAHRSLEKQAWHLASLCRMIKVVGASLHLHAVLERGLQNAIAAMGGDAGTIRVYDVERGDLALKRHHGLPANVLERLELSPAVPELMALREPIAMNLAGAPPRGSQGLHEELELFREAGFGGMALIPLATRTGAAGILSVYSRRPPATSFDDLSFLSAVGDLLSTALENAALHEEVTSLALTDPLTGLPNRRHFAGRLGEEVARARRSGRPFAVLLIDADHFKQVNDAWGHPVGDRILRQLSGVLRGTLRESDLVTRFGGEEFAALLPDTPRAMAWGTAERLRLAVEAHSFLTGRPGEPLRMRVSIGLAMVPEDGAALEAIIERADLALYAAKEAGRNCVRAVTGPRDGDDRSPGREARFLSRAGLPESGR